MGEWQEYQTNPWDFVWDDQRENVDIIHICDETTAKTIPVRGVVGVVRPPHSFLTTHIKRVKRFK
jgi:hypothetical protein